MWVYPEIRSLGQYPEYWARHDPERAALRTIDRTVDFREFDAVTNRVANHFLAADAAAPGTLIGFMGKNSFDFYFALFGIAKTRAGLVIYNWRLAAAELAAQIADSRARVAIVERECADLWNAACAGIGDPPEPIWIWSMTTDPKTSRKKIRPAIQKIGWRIW